MAKQKAAAKKAAATTSGSIMTMDPAKLATTVTSATKVTHRRLTSVVRVDLVDKPA